MGRRLKLHELLAKYTGSRTYFQPPDGFRLAYPCIVYRLEDRPAEYADNRTYLQYERYTVSYLHQDPDDDTPAQIMSDLGGVEYVRQFALNGVYHDIMRIYI